MRGHGARDRWRFGHGRVADHELADQGRTIQNRDVKKQAISLNRLSAGTQALIKAGAGGGSNLVGAQSAPARGAKGDTGATGAKGDTGPAGADGKDGAPGPRLATGNWGVVNRNTLGSPTALLRNGPLARAAGEVAATVAPPLGSGSLGLLVDDEPSTTDAVNDAEKIQYGNETDFAGLRVADLDAVSFAVFANDEQGNEGSLNVPMPTIQMEIDPDVDNPANGNAAVNYTTLNFLPPAPEATNAWRTYDAASAVALGAGSGWWMTGAAGTVTGCTLAAPCTLAALKEALGPDAAVSLSLGVAFGRGGSFQGAIDALRINGTVYDFEAEGVNAQPAS